MYSVLQLTFEIPTTSSPWKEKAPVQEELFGIERLEQHVQSLATTQPVTSRPQRVSSLRSRLENNAEVLLAAYRASAAELESGRGVVPAPGWLLDNHHLVEALVCEIRDDFPIGYYHRLPKAVAADVCSVAPYVRRGGWTWYTGAVGWVYCAGVEGDLGIHREGGWLTVEPTIPAARPGFEPTVSLRDCQYDIALRCYHLISAASRAQLSMVWPLPMPKVRSTCLWMRAGIAYISSTT